MCKISPRRIIFCLSSRQLARADLKACVSSARAVIKLYGATLNVQVVEKQSLVHDTKETIKEAQIKQSLAHQNIPTIIGVQLQKEPISLIMDFKWEQDTSVRL